MMRSSRSKGTASWHGNRSVEHLAHARRVSALFEDIGNLYWFTAGGGPAYHAISQTRRIGKKRVDEFFLHVIRGTEQKLFGFSSYS